jgi:hypothetical protein
MYGSASINMSATLGFTALSYLSDRCLPAVSGAVGGM